MLPTVTRKTFFCDGISIQEFRIQNLGTKTHSLAIAAGDVAREEALSNIRGRAGIAVVARDNTVVGRLEVEFQNVSRLGLDGVRVKCVVLGGCDFDGVGAGDASQSGGSEGSFERRHFGNYGNIRCEKGNTGARGALFVEYREIMGLCCLL